MRACPDPGVRTRFNFCLALIARVVIGGSQHNRTKAELFALFQAGTYAWMQALPTLRFTT